MNRDEIDLRFAGKLRHPLQTRFEILQPFGNRSIGIEIISIEPQEEEAVADRRRMIQGIIQAVTAKRREGVDAGRHEGRHTRRRAGNAWVKAHRRFNRRAIALGIPVADYPEGRQEPVTQLGAYGAFDLDPPLATVGRRHDAGEQERVGIWYDIVFKRRGTFEIDRFVGPVAILPDHGGGDSYPSTSTVLAKTTDLHFLWVRNQLVAQVGHCAA